MLDRDAAELTAYFDIPSVLQSATSSRRFATSVHRIGSWLNFANHVDTGH